MIRYILVDDNPKVLERVKAKIDAIDNDYQLEHIDSYSSSKKAFEEVNEADYDLLIVDYEMPVYNGIELAKKIATNKKIIFLTSTSNNEKKAINSLDVSGYLSKPFELEEFLDILKNKIIGKIHNKITKKNDFITLAIGSNKDIRFTPDKVYYISSSKNINGEHAVKNYVHFYGKNDELLFKNVRGRIKDLMKELSHYNFEKITQSTIINMSHVKERDNTNISLFDCKQPFEITKKEKSHFMSRFKNVFRF